LQAIAQAAEHIMCGFSEVAIGGGAESMSLLPMGGHNLSPNPTLVDTYPDTYLNMGLTAENLARKYGVTREQADEFSARSHRNAAAAIDAGRFKEEGAAKFASKRPSSRLTKACAATPRRKPWRNSGPLSMPKAR
jgi:acetyl-CoA acyltransferase